MIELNNLDELRVWMDKSIEAIVEYASYLFEENQKLNQTITDLLESNQKLTDECDQIKQDLVYEKHQSAMLRKEISQIKSTKTSIVKQLNSIKEEINKKFEKNSLQICNNQFSDNIETSSSSNSHGECDKSCCVDSTEPNSKIISSVVTSEEPKICDHPEDSDIVTSNID